jgi:NAD(P)-dependent dehydrogenase (short-subunit alcohol dehydrogenase family)
MPADVGTVLVTGGASGLGAAVATAVAERGGTPLVLDLRPPAGDVAFAAVDLGDTRAAEAAATALIGRHGGALDAVVTAAGIDVPGPFAEIAAPDWERIVAVNLLGTAAVVRAALPALRASNGRIVTVASTLGFRALGDATAYCASKFGVVGFTRALASELAGEIGVSLLVPGGMRTGFFDGREEQYRPGADARLNDPGDVAAAVLFALTQPAGCELRELVLAPATDGSWPP